MCHYFIIMPYSADLPVSSAQVELGPQGRLVIPAGLRTALGLQPGDRLVLTRDGDRLVIESATRVLARVQQLCAHLHGKGVIDELIAERRAAAKREDAEARK